MTNDIYVVIEHLRGQVADISYMLLAAARQLTSTTGGEVTAILLGYDNEGLANDLGADRSFYVNHPALGDFTPDAYIRTLTSIIENQAPQAVLFGHTSVGMDVASGLAIRLNLPLVSQCSTIEDRDGTLVFTSQICGGKIMAEGELPTPSALVTMIPGSYKPEDGRSTQAPLLSTIEAPDLENLRVRLTQYIEPEAGDVDISKESLLIGVGRGLQNQDDMEYVESLAQTLSGAVCASRPIIDLGWLPATRLVGKSGYSVKPKIYLALGISGAPEHVESITGSETIIAVNTDPEAPIFNMAQYGIEADMLDVVEALSERLAAEG
jgi:electron transfer flavoprotein alpha subunit